MAPVPAMFCDVLQNNELYGRWNGHMDASRWYSQVGTKCLSKDFKNLGWKHGIQVYFKGGKTIKNLLVVSKDNIPSLMKREMNYRYKWDRVKCDEEYIGKSARTFTERFKEHLKAPSISMTTATSQVTPNSWQPYSKLIFSGTELQLSWRQAFIHYCGLHQVWGKAEMQHLIWERTSSLSMLRTNRGVTSVT